MMDKLNEDLYTFMELDDIDEKELYKVNLKLETQHFIINYSEFDKPCIDKVSNSLEDNYKRITENLKQELQDKLVVEIQADLEQLHIAVGFPEAPDWVRGGLGSLGEIVIASPPINPPPGSQFDNVLNTAVHESVHILIRQINSSIPRWLDEGVASYEAKDNDENWIKCAISSGIK